MPEKEVKGPSTAAIEIFPEGGTWIRTPRTGSSGAPGEPEAAQPATLSRWKTPSGRATSSVLQAGTDRSSVSPSSLAAVMRSS